ncbi:MAG: hypothetical protein IKH75_11965 [Ruminococcus sp.]|nr:hypothetical protein [Ruminococcus sp.]
MSSVTKRISSISQPRGGYIKPSSFEIINLSDDVILNSNENIHGSFIGLVVDYMTRFCMGTDVVYAFKISLLGADRAQKIGISGAMKTALSFMEGIKGLDDLSIINACKLVTFDVWYRNIMAVKSAKSFKDINPDESTIQNIRNIIKRSLHFFDEYGPIVKDGFTFEPENGNNDDRKKMILTQQGTYGGYTPIVSSGDGDFLTKDTLWDFKVSKSNPTVDHTLQLLMYWIMGKHSGQEIYKKLANIGIFNPRLNRMYLLDMKNVPDDIIKTVEREVICYP